MQKSHKDQIEKLQMMENRLQSYMMQKQNFQGQLLEVENALNESTSAEEVYRIVGQVMIKTNKDELMQDLETKKNLLDKRIKDIEKKEEDIREEVLPIQKEVMKSLEDEQHDH